MSRLTWITEKEREIKSKGDEFCWKDNVKILYRPAVRKCEMLAVSEEKLAR